MEKVRNINTNLMSNIQDQKKANEKLQQDNQKFHECYLEIELERNMIQKELQEKVLEIAKSNREIHKLTTQLVEKGEKSSNCLENALSDQVEHLKSEIQISGERVMELTRDNKTLQSKLKNIERHFLV